MVSSHHDPYVLVERVGIKRAPLVITLILMLSLFGSLTLTITSAEHNPASALRRTSSIVSRPQAQHPKASHTISRPQAQHPKTSHTISRPQAQRPKTSSPRPRPTAVPSPTLTSARPSTEVGPQMPLLATGNTNVPEIALTFDDGPNPSYTPQILAILQEYGVEATFFDIGTLVATYPDLVRQEYNAGDSVGNHTWNHANLTLLSASQVLTQLDSTSNAIQATIGVRPTFFRPPYGAYNYQVLAQAQYLGITTVTWDDDSLDWTRPGVDAIVNRVLRTAHNGTIILMHDGGGNRSQTVAALPIIITELQNRGFQFVTIQQMADDIDK